MHDKYATADRLADIGPSRRIGSLSLKYDTATDHVAPTMARSMASGGIRVGSGIQASAGERSTIISVLSGVS